MVPVVVIHVVVICADLYSLQRDKVINTSV